MTTQPYTMTLEKNADKLERSSPFPKQKTTLQLSLPSFSSRLNDASGVRRHTLTVPPVLLFSSKARSPRVAFKPFTANDQVGYSAHARIHLHCRCTSNNTE